MPVKPVWKPLEIGIVMTIFAFHLPSIAASQTLEEIISNSRIDYYCCCALLIWWAGMRLLLRVCELHWRYDWYCLFQRFKFVGGLIICLVAGIGFLWLVFWNRGSADTPQISATLSTFLVWLAAGGCGAWVSQDTQRHACALTFELATPRYRIAIYRHFPSATLTLLARSGMSNEVQVIKTYMPVVYSLSGWSCNPSRWWAQQWQYQWNGDVFWDCSNAEVYVVMKSAQERLGLISASTLSMDVSQSNVLGVAKVRVQAMLARLPNVVWQAQVCCAIVTMLLESDDVRAGVQSHTGLLCGVKWARGTVIFKDEGTIYVENARTLACICLLALWEEAPAFYKLQHFINDLYEILPKVVSKWHEDEVRDKMRELALGVLLTIQGGV